MRREFAFALVTFLAASFTAAQQAAPPTPPPSTPPAAQTVYYAGPGVTAPELLPVNITDLATGRCKHLDGSVVLSAVIDEAGSPRNVDFVYRAGNALDEEAIKLVSSERFRPGAFDGAPAAIAVKIELDLQACVEVYKDQFGNKEGSISLKSIPNHSVEVAPKPLPEVTPSPNAGPAYLSDVSHETTGSISPPVPIYQPEAEFSNQARHAGFNGTCVVALIVDAQGNPQNVHIIKSLTPDLDQKAIEAVNKYRFRPARKKDGTPVATKITVEIDFHLYR
jgi:TonB family protein